MKPQAYLTKHGLAGKVAEVDPEVDVFVEALLEGHFDANPTEVPPAACPCSRPPWRRAHRR